MNWLRERISTLSSLLGLLLILLAFILLGFGLKLFNISSDALLSLISAIVGGLIATSSQSWISAQDRENQLRLAAADKRLQAHQEAYALWRKLIVSAFDETAIGKVALECQIWWDNNCLYLDSNARSAFYNAVLMASTHAGRLKSRDVTSVEKSWNTIEKAGEIIVKGASLPSLGDLESKFVETKIRNQ